MAVSVQLSLPGVHKHGHSCSYHWQFFQSLSALRQILKIPGDKKELDWFKWLKFVPSGRSSPGAPYSIDGVIQYLAVKLRLLLLLLLQFASIT